METIPKSEIDYNRLPVHIAIIMDGNGRWAKKRGLPRWEGHNKGVKITKNIVKTASDLGIKYLSLYTFSKENWKRSRQEVNHLLGLVQKYLKKEFQFYKDNNIRIKHIGDKSELPKQIVRDIEDTESETQGYEGLTVNLCLNYSGRYDIVQAVKKILAAGISEQNITEECISEFILTSGIPDPDLLIRTSGEMRISNMMLWQLAYSEICICEKLWPDFTEQDFIQILYNFQKRERRFGGNSE